MIDRFSIIIIYYYYCIVICTAASTVLLLQVKYNLIRTTFLLSFPYTNNPPHKRCVFFLVFFFGLLFHVIRFLLINFFGSGIFGFDFPFE